MKRAACRIRLVRIPLHLGELTIASLVGLERNTRRGVRSTRCPLLAIMSGRACGLHLIISAIPISARRVLGVHSTTKISYPREVRSHHMSDFCVIEL